MKVEEYFILLREYYREYKSWDEIEVTLNEVSNILLCTKRNSRLVLNKLSDLNLLKWNPGKGRGNKSTLVFLSYPEDLVFNVIIDLASKGNLSTSYRYLSFQTTPQKVKMKYKEWLDEQLGVKHYVEKGKSIDVIKVPIYTKIQSLEPSKVFYGPMKHILTNIFDNLVTFNYQTNNPEPHIAHYWDVSNKDLTWTIYLRKGVFFHNGKELTSDDVIVSINRIINSEYPLKYTSFLGIKQLESVHNYCFKIHLYKPNSLLLHFFSQPEFSILPSKHISEEDSEVIGTGPYQLLSNKNNVLILGAFQYYFKERPHIDKLEIWSFPNDKNMAITNSDIIFNPPEEITRNLGSWKSFSTQISKMLIFNSTKINSPLLNKSIRKIISTSLNIETLIDLGNSKKKEDLGANIDGYNGELISIYTTTTNEREMEWIKIEFNKLSINAKLEQISPDELYRADVYLKADIIISGFSFDYSKEISILTLIFKFFGLFTIEVQESIQKQLDLVKSSYNPNLRKKSYDKIFMILKENYCIKTLYKKQIDTKMDSSILWNDNQTSNLIDFRNIWIKNTDTCSSINKSTNG
ncbi:ABC transporter substrate-binding protein [Bacillus sp. CGMCC 1.16607]|uniref:ABC transporter substrate-binding protein n=1 Tax=Bacillus sp. CGMCC 1.16607 TaxID=3351842 RepID=UPI00362CC692